MTCYTTIESGEQYMRETYVYEGHLYTWKTCAGCFALTNTVYSWCADPYEGVGPEQYLEWALENRELPESAEYLERLGWEDPDD